MYCKLQKRDTQGSYYSDESGENRFLLRVVDRDYKGVKKAPKYYLNRIKGDKRKYVSGMFKTKEKGVLSFDVLDELGQKQFFKAVISEGGKVLEMTKTKGALL